MMHPEGFLAEVLERPWDDSPRLRYADWLDAKNDRLGEFIRVQCRLDKLPADHPDVLALEDTQHELLAEFEKTWVGDLAGMVRWWGFRRGFVEEVGLSSGQFIEYGTEIFRRAPIQEIHLSQVRDRLDRLTASALLRKPSHLDLSSNPVRDQGASTLAQCPHLAQVRGLNLSSSGIGDRGLKALASSPYLTGLRELYLDDNKIGEASARVLAVSPLASRLDALYLRFNPLGGDGAALLQRRFGERVHL